MAAVENCTMGSPLEAAIGKQRSWLEIIQSTQRSIKKRIGRVKNSLVNNMFPNSTVFWFVRISLTHALIRLLLIHTTRPLCH
jgi:hypothetical protein